jgi:hypothetical protein
MPTDMNQEGLNRLALTAVPLGELVVGLGADAAGGAVLEDQDRLAVGSVEGRFESG